MVEKRSDLVIGGQTLDGFPFEHRLLILNLIKDGRLEHKKSAIDPTALSYRLLLEASDRWPVKVQTSKSRWCLNRRDGHRFAMAPMEFNRRSDVHIAYAIAIRHAEHLVVPEIRRNISQAPTGPGILTGIDQGDFPGFRDALMHVHPILFDIERDVRRVQEVVSKVFFDQVPFVSAAYDEVVDVVLGINLQNVPENRFSAYLDHRLGAGIRYFT